MRLALSGEQTPETEPGSVVPETIVTGVTRYERVTSFLMSLVITLGIVTVALGAVWAANQTWIVRRASAKVEVLEIIEDVPGGGSEEGMLDESLEKPGPESTLQDPADAFDPDEVVADFPEMEQTMTAVLEAASGAAAMSDQLLTADQPGTSALVVGSRGTGPYRNLGKGPGEGGGVKRQERWEIRFPSGQTVQEYARQLDYFRVELGAITGGKLYTASNLSSRRPNVRQSSGGPGETRLYFSWRGVSRRQVDLELLDKAAVPLSDNVIVLQFYPFETEQLLARLERDHLEARGKNDLRLVRKTRFAAVKQGSGYSFEVIKQEYFGDPPSR